MRRRDTFDVACSMAAALADLAAFVAGFMLAEWTRFDSGWLAGRWFSRWLYPEPPPDRRMYWYGAWIIALLMLFIYRALGLYVRPQLSAFSEKIPRLTRATGLGVLLAMALAFTIRTEPPFSRVTVGLAFFTVLGLVLLERGLLFRFELAAARRRPSRTRVAVLGTDDHAARLRTSLEREPRLRSQVVAFLRTGDAPPVAGIPPELVAGGLDDLKPLLDAGRADHVILADPCLSHERRVQILLDCERTLVSLQMVPDLFSIMTSQVEVSDIGGIPLVGLRPWPLDHVWNRMAKRTEDIIGALIGLALSAPVLAAAAVLIKRDSRGPVFFSQDRCGEKGRVFRIHKLRTMRPDAEAASGPVFATEDDPRRTRVGGILRAYNLDELPQFWNVLKGEMSLVGPRPERPHFVEKFREDIGRYMWRHVSRPGMTGWAQVNGLRGDTDIRERIRYDLFYLEHWSLALDFKILVRTFFSRKNAY